MVDEDLVILRRSRSEITHGLSSSELLEGGGVGNGGEGMEGDAGVGKTSFECDVAGRWPLCKTPVPLAENLRLLRRRWEGWDWHVEGDGRAIIARCRSGEVIMDAFLPSGLPRGWGLDL